MDNKPKYLVDFLLSVFFVYNWSNEKLYLKINSLLFNVKGQWKDFFKKLYIMWLQRFKSEDDKNTSTIFSKSIRQQ